MSEPTPYEKYEKIVFCPLCGSILMVLKTPIDDVKICNGHNEIMYVSFNEKGEFVPLFDPVTSDLKSRGKPLWDGGIIANEPPQGIDHVQDSEGHIADRTDAPCMYCFKGSIWRWRHNGGSDCWLDIDGTGPWTVLKGDEDG